jgi:hypothetical protein
VDEVDGVSATPDAEEHECVAWQAQWSGQRPCWKAAVQIDQAQHVEAGRWSAGCDEGLSDFDHDQRPLYSALAI